MKKVITVLVIVCSTLSLFAQNETKIENSKGTQPLPATEDAFTFDGRYILSNRDASRIGLGTSSPLKFFHVQGDSYFSSKVGIGTSNPSTALDVNGTIKATSIEASNYIGIKEGLWEERATGTIYYNGSIGINIAEPREAFHIGTGNALIEGNITGNSNLFINGKVGIGKETADSELDVAGDFSIIGDNTAFGKGKLIFSNNSQVTKFHQTSEGLNIVPSTDLDTRTIIKSNGDVEVGGDFKSHSIITGGVTATSLNLAMPFSNSELNFSAANGVTSKIQYSENGLIIFPGEELDTETILRPNGDLEVSGKIQTGTVSSGKVETTNLELIMPFSPNKFNLTQTSEGLEIIPSEDPTKKTIFKSNGDVEFTGNIIGVESSHWNFENSNLTFTEGNVGIGTDNPDYKLDIRGFVSIGGSDLRLGIHDGRDQGTKLANRALVHGELDNLIINYSGDFEGGIRMMGPKVSVDGDFTTGVTKLLSDKMVVDGTIYATEVQIVNSSELPQSDYVFESDYKLRTLEEVEQFVKTNKHLPEVPSAADFKENGYSIGQMDDILLRKVEELTLYIIAQEKRIQKLEEENNKLKGE